MSLSGFFAQLLNGLASASTLFLLASGLSLIFGVTRIVNFAHGSLYMLGAYIAWSVAARLSGFAGFWLAMLLSAMIAGALGALIEITILRRIYRAPELLQLLATFALTLIARDAILWIWGPEDLLGPRAPGLSGSIDIFGRPFPQYDLALILIGPLVLLILQLILKRTLWGMRVRAATQDREMLGALGVNQAILFTSVFALGAALAGLGGALNLPREPANAAMDVSAIGEAFVIVVVGGMGSIPGAYVAALIIAEIKALCIALGVWEFPFGVTLAFPKLTLVAEFIVMAVVLILRPWGLFGRQQAAQRAATPAATPLKPASARLKSAAALLLAFLAVLPMLTGATAYALVLAIDIGIGMLFALSLQFIMGPGGMNSFGHAAYFGVGAYTAALFLKMIGAPMEICLMLAPIGGACAAILAGWFCIRLTGVYFSMLTLAFAQIVWSIAYQWDAMTGGSNGLVGVWPAPWLATKQSYYYLTLVVCVASVVFMRSIVFSPFGYALRAVRDSDLRGAASGIDVKGVQWIAFILAGGLCGLAGGLFAFSKGSISPEIISVGHSVDGLVMVLLGGLHALIGPIIGASVFIFLQDEISRHFDYWRAILGLFILSLVLLFPQGLVGAAQGGAVRRGVKKMAATNDPA